MLSVHGPHFEKRGLGRQRGQTTSSERPRGVQFTSLSELASCWDFRMTGDIVSSSGRPSGHSQSYLGSYVVKRRSGF